MMMLFGLLATGVADGDPSPQSRPHGPEERVTILATIRRTIEPAGDSFIIADNHTPPQNNTAPMPMRLGASVVFDGLFGRITRPKIFGERP